MQYVAIRTCVSWGLNTPASHAAGRDPASLLEALNMETRKDEIRKLMKEIDTDGNGSLDVDEFKTIFDRLGGDFTPGLLESFL